MKLSYHWLQTYFSEPLPEPDKLAELLTFHAYEVEGVEQVETHEGTDHILDVDVLPNRASDSLCHRGVAREIAKLTEMEITERAWEAPEQTGKGGIAVHVEEPALCKRYIAKIIEHVAVGETPAWLAGRLTAIGERSINGIVDTTNFVLFDMGQPLHAFDADKIEGGEIHIRKAKEGETLTTLDGTEVTFDGGELIIADTKDPIAIAGVKGGSKAEIDEHTSRIVLEAAHFHPVSVRKTARKLGILTDASKRFENEITIHWAEEAIGRATALITDLPKCEQAVVSESADVYDTLPQPFKTGVSVSEVNTLLGTQMLGEEVERILNQARLPYERIEYPATFAANEAARYEGAAYTYGASVSFDAPERFDCSSLLVYVFAHAGVTIPRQAIDQFVFGQPVEESDLVPGDIVFSRNPNPQEHAFTLKDDGTEVTHTGAKEESELFLPGTRVEGGVSHNGIYVGDGAVIHAHPEHGVIKEQLNESAKFAHIVGYRRITEAQTERYAVTVPRERLDIRGSADLVEEVGRLYGYRNIDSEKPADSFTPQINKQWFYTSLIHKTLIERGFSEIYTYAFQRTGEVALANPLAKNRAYMRADLTTGIAEALDLNERHAPLLAGDDIRVFETGVVFSAEGEHTALGLGVRMTKGKKKEERSREVRADALSAISEALGVHVPADEDGDVSEANISPIIDALPEPTAEDYEAVLTESSETHYTPISPYPFVLRDIAAWTPAGTTQEEFAFLIKEYAGDMLAKEPECFDVFEKPASAEASAGKDGRVSYAFNLVFQSHERTLTDAEVNTVMDEIYNAIEQKEGWEAR